MMQGYDEQNEAVFLRQQAEDAKIALHQTLTAMQETAKTAADIRALTQQYPWLAVGATAAAGFIATTIVLPSSRQSSEALAATPPSRGSALSSFIRSSLWGIVRATVMSTVAGLLASTQTDSEADQPVPHAMSDRTHEGGTSVDISS
jgi:putative exporter of polyketide antibiotics